MKIQKHELWKQVKTYQKPIYLARFWAAQNIAKLFSSEIFVAVTGSVGKTTTALMCENVLSQKYKTAVEDYSIDPVFAAVKLLLGLRPGIKKAIMEISIRFLGEVDLYLSLVRPQTLIVTRLSAVRSESLGGLEKISEEVGKLIKELPKKALLVLNWDDVATRKLVKEYQGEVIFYGTDSKACHIWASNVRIENGITLFELNYGVERVEVALKFLGKHFVYSALAAASLGMSLGLSLINIKRGLEMAVPASHCLELLNGLGDWVVIDDTISSSPASAEEAINTINSLPARRRIVVLGEMRQLGIYSEDLHRKLARKIFSDKIDYVLLGSGDAVFIADELIKLGMLPERVEVNLSNSQIIPKILKIAGCGDVVLVKGSKTAKLNEVVSRITKK